MTHKQIQDLIKLIGKTDLSELRIKDGEFELLLRTKDFFKSKRSDSGQVMSQPVSSFVPFPSANAPAAPAPESSVAKTASSPAKEATEEQSAENYLEVKSPIVGTFYRSSSPDKPPFIKVGDKVSSGDVVCIVEAMKLFNEIESEVSGTVVKVLVEDASPVEYDQVLFLVDPNA